MTNSIRPFISLLGPQRRVTLSMTAWPLSLLVTPNPSSPPTPGIVLYLSIAFMWTLSPLKLLKVTAGPTGPVPQAVVLPVPPAVSSPLIRVRTMLLLTPLNSSLGAFSRRLVGNRLARFSLV